MYGKIEVSGSKNAALAILPAVILCDQECIVEGVPKIKDVGIMIELLRLLGAKISTIAGDESRLRIDPTKINTCRLTGKRATELAGEMRASYYLLGALMGRFGEAEVPSPGGCSFCFRPMDQHVKVFRALGGTCDDITEENWQDPVIIEKVERTKEKVTIAFGTPSVGATMNAILAAVKSNGKTVIKQAAKEPHVVDLANFLAIMGANIIGAGTDTIIIHGVEYLRGATYTIIPDQIEAGTYMAAVAATSGAVTLTNVIPQHLDSIIEKFIDIGVSITEYSDSIYIERKASETFKGCKITTEAHPGFPTDMQSQFAAMLTSAVGESEIIEHVWQQRAAYVRQLKKMGANAEILDKIVIKIKPMEKGKKLQGAKLNALDLRAGAAIVIAGLIAEGTTEIGHVDIIERGYENMVAKLSKLGANIKVVECDICDDIVDIDDQ